MYIKRKNQPTNQEKKIKQNNQKTPDISSPFQGKENTLKKHKHRQNMKLAKISSKVMKLMKCRPF